MNEQLPQLFELMRHLQQVPFLASKNIYRVAQHFLDMSEPQLKQFLEALERAHRSTVKCACCFAWKEINTTCYLCESPKRNQRMVCIVETWHDLCAIERSGMFTGTYHVLGGAISPLDGITPEDLTIQQLCTRAQSPEIEELILALNQTLEGEATAVFIVRALGQLRTRLKISTLSRGVPIGGRLEGVDRLTLGKAFLERRLFS